jgi:chromate transporter
MMAFLELFLTFFMIGACTFGGGYAMMPLMQEQVALRWNDIIPQETITNFIAVSESTPGPFAVNMATYVGSEVAGLAGSACATLGVILPSFIIILIVAKCYEKFRNSSIVKGCMTGLKPAVVGLIAGAILTVASGVFFPAGVSLAVLQTPAFYLSAGIFLVMLVLALKKVHPILLILMSAVAGIVIGYLGLW